MFLQYRFLDYHYDHGIKGQGQIFIKSVLLLFHISTKSGMVIFGTLIAYGIQIEVVVKPDVKCKGQMDLLLTLKAPMTTAADDKFCDIFLNFGQK